MVSKKEHAFAIPAHVMEGLAAMEHERWSHWQRYMHSKCDRRPDGSLVVPADLVSRWERLLNTPYAELTEDEKASDREQVERYLPVLQEAMSKAR